MISSKLLKPTMKKQRDTVKNVPDMESQFSNYSVLEAGAENITKENNVTSKPKL